MLTTLLCTLCTYYSIIQLRKVTKLPQSQTGQKAEERDSLLEQIRAKVKRMCFPLFAWTIIASVYFMTVIVCTNDWIWSWSLVLQFETRCSGKTQHSAPHNRYKCCCHFRESECNSSGPTLPYIYLINHLLSFYSIWCWRGHLFFVLLVSEIGICWNGKWRRWQWRWMEWFVKNIYRAALAVKFFTNSLLGLDTWSSIFR